MVENFSKQNRNHLKFRYYNAELKVLKGKNIRMKWKMAELWEKIWNLLSFVAFSAIITFFPLYLGTLLFVWLFFFF